MTSSPVVCDGPIAKVVLFLLVTALLAITATFAKIEDRSQPFLFSGTMLVTPSASTNVKSLNSQIAVILGQLPLGPYAAFTTTDPSRLNPTTFNLTVAHSLWNISDIETHLNSALQTAKVHILGDPVSKKMQHYTFTLATLVETVKLIFALVFFLMTYDAKNPKRPPSRDRKCGTLKQVFIFSVPAALYLIDNNLFYVVVELIGPVKYHLFNNVKTLVTAILFRTFLKRKLSGNQWVALLILMTGILVTQQGEILRKQGEALHEKCLAVWEASRASGPHPSSHALPKTSSLLSSSPSIPPASGSPVDIAATPDPIDSGIHTFAGIFSSWTVFLGFLLTGVMAVSSSFANIWAEYIYKRDVRENFYQQNAYLYVWGILMNAGVLIIRGYVVTDDLRTFGVFSGFTAWTPVVIFSQAVYGFSIAHVLKVLDNIANVFAHAFAFILTVVIAAIWLHFQPSILFFSGSSVAFCAMFVYQNSRVKQDDLTGLVIGGDEVELYSIGSAEWDPPGGASVGEGDSRTEITLSDTEL
eukprot:TRINITY_DN14058_c0_g1_i1.p1 TRINITY_DN14058_c0_g1~~TRINITY_DN14058_c0_g1_i1.p1  ORF type:complete len:528 (-),score=40.66 TRINITY_DN14058_c0_g1_i1:406-1989(-)